MQFDQLLQNKRFDPAQILALRHRPFEPELRRVLLWLAAEKPQLFNAYQRAQRPKVESALTRAQYVASFIGHSPGKAVFVGLYEVKKWRPITHRQYWQKPENKQLKSLGMHGYDGKKRSSILWFDLDRIDFYSGWIGKLIVTWPKPERSWSRWVSKNQFTIDAILEDSLLVGGMPSWDQINLTWDQLKALPRSWRERLSQWRGIYFILDTSTGKGYVGSAYGAENILSRWSNYARTGHGGNRLLRGCHPGHLRFSILQLFAVDTKLDEVVGIEGRWKDRLHTRHFGLNGN